MTEDKADTFLRMIRRASRGRLKVYLGYAAGVGKTYEMLLEAHRLKNEGIDVVVGLVETHGREATARLIEGLEVIPRRRQEYRGIELEEMDLDAILARRPQIVLVDELAHTNVPGSLNAKRYQDVQDLLTQGIHVITTLNVQHLESLYDIVERSAGIRVSERLPDSVLAEADQIVNVDVTTEDLNERLKEGKVYPRERIETALANFFRKANLEQLRELTLRELASQIDLKSRDTTEPDMAAAPDQVMVCLSSRGPNSNKLLRYASRLAGRLNRNWYAVYVQTPSESPTQIDAQSQRMLADTLTLAKQLGAIVFTYKGEDIVGTILQFAKEYRVGHIVIGSPERLQLWNRLLGRRTIAERLITEARDCTVVVLDTREVAPSPAPPLTPEMPDEETPRPPDGTVQLQDADTVLSPHGIIIWDKPVTRDVALQALIEALPRVKGKDQTAAFLKAVLEREQQGSTFVNEGVAFPHARIPGLARSAMVVGLTRAGVADVLSDRPIEYIFLIVSPLEQPDEQTRLLRLAGKASLDRQLRDALRLAHNPEHAYRLISDWMVQGLVNESNGLGRE